jgi:polyisoprenoid-binding protein YceI
MLRILVFIVASASLPVCAAQCYTVDSARGSVSYEVKQAGSPFRGTFRRFGGEICLADGHATRIEVWLDPASVDSGLPEIDAALRDRDFFAVIQYPRVVYSSLSVQARGDAQLAQGMLQMKGKRRNLNVSFRLQDGAGGFRVSGSLMLDRLDYAIGTGEWSNTAWLGNEVRVEFQAALSAK